MDFDSYNGTKRTRRDYTGNKDVFGYRFDQPTKKGEDAWLPGITQPLFVEADSTDVARHERGQDVDVSGILDAFDEWMTNTGRFAVDDVCAAPGYNVSGRW